MPPRLKRRHIAENIKSRYARFKLRRHHLFHGDNAAVRVVAELDVEVVTLTSGSRKTISAKRQVDVHWLSIAMTVSGLRHPSIMVNLLVSVERIGPGEHAHIFSGGNLTDLPFS